MAVPFLFDEILFDPDLFGGEEGQAPLEGWQGYANTHVKNRRTAVYKTNVNRVDGFYLLTFSPGLLTADKLNYFLRMWNGGYGSGVGFRVRIPWEFQVTDEVFATAQAGVLAYPLKISYTRPNVTARTNTRRIVKPVTNIRLKDLGSPSGSVTLLDPNSGSARTITQELVIKVGNTVVTNYEINNTTGWAYFATQPTVGQPLKVTMQWDVPMAFVGNDLPHRWDINGQMQNVQLREVPPAELGIYA